jgi:hypothetical protein
VSIDELELTIQNHNTISGPEIIDASISGSTPDIMDIEWGIEKKEKKKTNRENENARDKEK